MSIKISVSPDAILEISSVITWQNAFVQAMRNMDVVKIAELVEDDIIVNDQTKWEFLSTIRDRLSHLKSIGNINLVEKTELCTYCFKGCEIHFFEGNTMGTGIGIYFDYKDGKLNDIIICNGSSGSYSKQEHKDSTYEAWNRFDMILQKKNN